MAIIAMSLVSRSTISGRSHTHRKAKADNSRPPLIQINTDISGKTKLLLY